MIRILLIDDDPGAQLLLNNRLIELGYEVVVAATGARGLLEARAERFDLFLVDIGLGSGIDGFEVCRRLKGMPQIHALPVVLISNQSMTQEDLHRGYEAGCESFLVKDDLALIEDVVRVMLRIKSLQDELAMQNRLLEERNRYLDEERKRGADLESALRNADPHGFVFSDLAASQPDGVMLVDQEGIVRMTDRGVQDIFGKDMEGRQLANLAPDSGLEAFVRNARLDCHESHRFDLEWSNGSTRSMSASVMPTVPRGHDVESRYKVVMLLDAGKRRIAGEMLRQEDQGVPRREIGPLLEAAHRSFQVAALVGDSQPMQQLRAEVQETLQASGPVLIGGGSGSGKSLVARILHFAGSASGPFVPVNCGALAPEMLESELFGHVAGAFPEATADRPGLFVQAQNGTVFLNHVSEISPAMQSRLLDLIQRQSVQRLGAKQPEAVKIRLVVGSSRDLSVLVQQGQFNSELLQCFKDRQVTLPPLRERDQDIGQLARSFALRYGSGRGIEISTEADWVLREYDWPGNVGELERCIESACTQCRGHEIQVNDLSAALFERYQQLSKSDSIPVPLQPTPGRELGASRPDPLDEDYGSPARLAEIPSLEAYEKQAILHALSATRGDKLAAAKLLKIGKSTFYRKLKSHGLS